MLTFLVPTEFSALALPWLTLFHFTNCFTSRCGCDVFSFVFSVSFGGFGLAVGWSWVWPLGFVCFGVVVGCVFGFGLVLVGLVFGLLFAWWVLLGFARRRRDDSLSSRTAA